MNICVCGDTGLLGQAILRRWPAAHRFLGVSTHANGILPSRKIFYHHLKCDVLREEGKFYRQIKAFKAALIVNGAGLVDVAGCERFREKAMRLNAQWPHRLASFAHANKIALIHISTDQVFDGRKKTPYKEKDAPRPVNHYGRTKLQGEHFVLKHAPESLVVRTNIVGFRGLRDRPTFAEWLSGALCRGQDIVLADDFVTSSIHVDFLSDYLWLAFKKKLRGLYHVASADALSKYAFGKRMAEYMKVGFDRVKKGRLSDMNLKPPRPPYLALECGRIQSVLGRELPTTERTIARLAKDFFAVQKERL